ncbi:MAG: aminotransferase class I/II-fold pyridoxal phosphate-dependent enzyme [Candidatus Liptonbacteria bacterium]|nr:aminotransferase class I/II-fold pyridoxal phosphate-dependent enzyme [Candidatus Liptonbacteria bacterium]
MQIKHHLAEDTIDDKDISALIDWLKTNSRLTKGPLTLEFEKKWSNWWGKKYSVFCNSGSSANLLMYYVLLLSSKLKNKKIIVPSAGWPTTITPAIQFGFEPIMCEADKDTFALDVDYLEELLKKHDPGAVIFVQILGVPHKHIDKLLALKEKYKFVLLEDACAAMGASHRGRKAGTFGDMSSFSLYFGHQLSTIEGGVVSTDDQEFNNLLLMSRSHGWGKDLDPDSHGALLNKYNVDNSHNPFIFYEPGLNLRATDLQAFLGLRQLDKMDWLVERRSRNHHLYKKLLGEKFYAQSYDNDIVPCSIHFCALANDSAERKTVADALHKNGIETRLYTAGNLGLHPFWANRYGEAHFKWADELYNRGFFLPNHPSLKTEDVKFISKVVLDAVKR